MTTGRTPPRSSQNHSTRTCPRLRSRRPRPPRTLPQTAAGRRGRVRRRPASSASAPAHVEGAPPTIVFFGVLSPRSVARRRRRHQGLGGDRAQRYARTSYRSSSSTNHLTFTLAYNKGGAWGLLQNASESDAPAVLPRGQRRRDRVHRLALRPARAEPARAEVGPAARARRRARQPRPIASGTAT